MSGCSAGVPGTAAPDPSVATWSVRSALATLPASGLDEDDSSVLINVGDLDRATELAGVSRPSSNAGDDVIDWAFAVSGTRSDADTRPAVSVRLPEVLAPTMLAQTEEFVDELGWGVLDVSSYAEISATVDTFSVLDGDFASATLTAAMGDPVDGIWRVGPADGEMDMKNRTPARPLGESLRLGMQGGRVAVARTTDPVADWLAGGDRLDSDATLAELVSMLDQQQVYSAVIVPNADGYDASNAVLDPFDSLGIGVAVDTGEPVIVFSYHFPDDATAAANVETLQSLVADGDSAAGRPWSDLLTVRSVSSAGPVLVGVFGLSGDTTPDVGWRILFLLDTLVIHT